MCPPVVPKIEFPTSLFISNPPLPKKVQTASIYPNAIGVPEFKPIKVATLSLSGWVTLLPSIISGNRFFLLVNPKPSITFSSY